MKKKFNDVEKAIYARLREVGCSFWIVDFVPWVHPLNKVLNCWALMGDGFILAKFQEKLAKDKKTIVYKLREFRHRGSVDIAMEVGEEATWEQLIEKFRKGTVYTYRGKKSYQEKK